MSGGDADLRRVHSHGVLRVPDYVQASPRVRLCVVCVSGVALVIDGGDSMGQIGGVLAPT